MAQVVAAAAAEQRAVERAAAAALAAAREREAVLEQRNSRLMREVRRDEEAAERLAAPTAPVHCSAPAAPSARELPHLLVFESALRPDELRKASGAISWAPAIAPATRVTYTEAPAVSGGGSHDKS